jgi:hypothetical protein
VLFLSVNDLNAVKSQIGIAVATYVLVAIIKRRLHLDPSLHAMLQIPSVTPFEKAPLLQLLTETVPMDETTNPGNQMTLLCNVSDTTDAMIG